MSISLLFFSSDSAWESYNDGSGDTLVSVVARGGDNLLTGSNYELVLEDETETAQDEDNFEWTNGGDVEYTLSWDASLDTLTLTITNSAVPVSQSLSWVIPSPNLPWSVLSIRASVLNDGETKTSRIRTLSTEFNSSLLGVYELDVDGEAVAGTGSTVNVVAIVASGEDLNEDWELTGSLRFSWPGTYPDDGNMTLTLGLSSPSIERSAADTACLEERQGQPPTCQEAIGDACFRYEYDCVGGEWVLDFAECVDNSLCASSQSVNCEVTKFEFEERNTCFSGGTVPTPTTPDLTNNCFCL